jgi:DNA-binding transcriptional ArsR family regulator
MRHRPVINVGEAAFSALADPTRRAVLDLLRKGSQPAGQIASAFPISRPAISKHLRLLHQAHLAEERGRDAEEGEALGGIAQKFPTRRQHRVSSDRRRLSHAGTQGCQGMLCSGSFPGGQRSSYSQSRVRPERHPVHPIKKLPGTPSPVLSSLPRSHHCARAGNQHRQENGCEDFDSSQQPCAHAFTTGKSRGFRN